MNSRTGIMLAVVLVAALGIGFFLGTKDQDPPANASALQEQSDSESTEQLPDDKPQQEPIDVAGNEPQAKSEPKVEPRTKQPVAEPKRPPEPVYRSVSVPTGTPLTLALETLLRTDSNAVGDRFAGRTTEPILAEGATVIPAGSAVEGRITQLEEPHRTAGKAQMTLVVDRYVDADGREYTLNAQPLYLEGEGDKVSDEGKVGIGAAAGAVLGALTSKNKGKGALKGAAAGAVAGGVVAIATKGKQLVLEPGQNLQFELGEGNSVQVKSETASSN
ncbi:MAG TPA: YMGG-like glycine zipper-containing protein [candidate division Zixibacteria bacterium]